MTNSSNPWITRSAEPDIEPEAPGPAAERPASTGPTSPQAGVPAPKEQLPVRDTWSTSELWVVGAHGGAGESAIAGLVSGWDATGHVWPRPVDGTAAPVVLVARTHLRGLLAARAAATQWAAGLVPHADVLGLVLIADAPGRLPRPLRDLAQVVSGGVPRTWMVPWIESWRIAESPALADAPRATRRMVDELHGLIPTPRADGAS